MGPALSRRAFSVVAVLAAIGPDASVRGGDPPSDTLLARHGMKRSGPLLILGAEAAVHARADEVRTLSQDLGHAIARQRATVGEKEYQATIKELNDELNALRGETSVVTQNINRMPRRRGFPVYQEQFQEMTYYRDQLQTEIGQRTSALNQLKSQPFDPKDRIRADAEVGDRRQALATGAAALRKLVDEVRTKYKDVEKDPQVKAWLNTPEGPARVKPKLGPSRAFLLDEKILERAERQSGSDAFGFADGKASRKGKHHRLPRSKRSAASHATGSPS